MKRKAVLVAGMHRSGTSALTYSLSCCGASLPKSLLVGKADNPQGFWEPAEIVQLHDQMFSVFGMAWYHPFRIPGDWASSPGAIRFCQQLLQVLKNNFPSDPFLLIKDPRLCRFVPLWREVLQEFGASAHFVIPLRNPLEIAQSLLRRDQFVISKSLVLTLRYFLDAEYHSRGCPRSFVAFDELLADPMTQLARVIREMEGRQG